ncbi:MAG: hypothetical protein J5966_09900 [Lachnospiraceae bacterium]|nr:hypothetical protein [Lachnospiraceae bacterium]
MSNLDNKKGKLDESQLDRISGGVIFDASDIDGADSRNPWELLDDTTGATLGRFPSRDAAVAAAGSKGKNHMVVNWDQVQELRGLK